MKWAGYEHSGGKNAAIWFALWTRLYGIIGSRVMRLLRGLKLLGLFNSGVGWEELELNTTCHSVQSWPVCRGPMKWWGWEQKRRQQLKIV